jgi:hypothetical protein
MIEKRRIFAAFNHFLFCCIQRESTSAAKAGEVIGSYRRAKALLHPVAANGVKQGERAKALLHPVDAAILE